LASFSPADDVRADVLRQVAAADREHQHRILVVRPTGSQPRGEHGVPTLVVGARGEFRDVVGGRIGFDAAELAEIVDRVAAVAGAAADAEQEQPPAALAQGGQLFREALDLGLIDRLRDFDDFLEVDSRYACGGLYGRAALEILVGERNAFAQSSLGFQPSAVMRELSSSLRGVPSGLGRVVDELAAVIEHLRRPAPPARRSTGPRRRRC
jgi:hypothetical protein